MLHEPLRPLAHGRVNTPKLLAIAVVLMLGWLVACGDDDGSYASNVGSADAGKDTAQDSPDAKPEGGEGGTAPKPCVPRACAQVEAECGTVPDGCDGTIDCGECTDGLTCGGGGPNVCGTNACVPKTCVQAGAQCGWVSDECSLAIECGGCASPQTCGGGGKANACGCTPRTCAQLGAQCGTVLDGCEGTLDCGTCAGSQVCGGGGPNVCGSSECEAKTCSQLGASCGLVSDGCSEVIDCGECSDPLVCGGGGVENECGCTPKTCAQLGASCGTVNTGCGEENCGSCSPPETCEGGGVENQCGCTCTLPHATTHCAGGVCTILACEDGWDDCDGAVDTGCETDLSSSTSHCGACGQPCSFPNASASCDAGACKVGTCSGGFGNCDGQEGNGCEAVFASDANNCGTCGRTCSGACTEGTCEYTSPETGRKWDQTYHGSGTQYTHNTTLNYQGYYLESNGVLKSAIGAPDPMFTDLSGATVLDIWVYLYADHWYYFAGGTARIGVHGNSTKPTTFPGINQDYAVNFARDEGKWVRLPTAWYDSFKSGSYRGITLHAANSTAGQYYGYMTASATKWKWRYRK